MQDFLTKWTELVTDPDTQMQEETIRRLLVDKLKGKFNNTKSVGLKEDISYFERMDVGDPNYSHAWLIGRMQA